MISKSIVQKAFQYTQKQVRRRKVHYNSIFIFLDKHPELEFITDDEIRVLIKDYLKPRYEQVWYHGLEEFLPPDCTQLYHNARSDYVGRLLTIRWPVEHAYKRVEQFIQFYDDHEEIIFNLNSHYDTEILSETQIEQLFEKIKKKYPSSYLNQPHIEIKY